MVYSSTHLPFKKTNATIHVGEQYTVRPSLILINGILLRNFTWNLKITIRKGKTSSKSSFLGSMLVFGGVLFIQVTSMHPKSCVGLESCSIGLSFMRGSLIEASRFLYRPRRLEDAPRLCKSYMFFVDATFVVNLCVCFLSIHFSSPGLIVILYWNAFRYSLQVLGGVGARPPHFAHWNKVIM